MKTQTTPGKRFWEGVLIAVPIGGVIWVIGYFILDAWLN